MSDNKIAGQFECSVYDLLSRHGFMEGDALIPEEEPLVAKACAYLADALGVVDCRWKAEVVCQHYVNFVDLTTKQTISFYDMAEIDRRKIQAVIEQKQLAWICVSTQFG